MITLILLIIVLLLVARIRHRFKFQRATAGRSRAPIAEEVVDLRVATALQMLVLLRCCVVSLVPMHLGVLSPRNAALLFRLVG